MHTPVIQSTGVRKIKRVFIANRGEIAVRVVRACHALGIEAVVGISEVDAATLAARIADRAVVIGSAAPADSYLNAEKLIAAAIEAGCEAVHPGYGFLSERAVFARACIDAGLVFIGPSPGAIESMGDKISAVKLAEQAGVPCVPGSAGLIDADEARQRARKIGYPVLVKATAGGGGRGMRIVRQEADLDASMESAANEARAAFGDPTLYIEKFIEHARHIEIQVMGDTHGNVVSLGERECSTQRRHQKLIEEAPSPVVDPALRAKMGDCAVRLARRVNYVGAGTVEFILDSRDNRFYFLEMNTRIQVEHPVTEMVLGIDLVAEQIRVAAGERLSFSQESLKIRGHSIECRINAEDFNRNFLPKPGLIGTWEEPSGEGVRVDTHCYAGYSVPPNYDSLLAKLIVHADTREQAVVRMRNALAGFSISGPPSTVPFHLEVLNSDDFVNGRVTTQWVEQQFLPRRKTIQSKADTSRTIMPAK